MDNNLLKEELNKEEFLQLLKELISETPNLMNQPPDYIPNESKAAAHVINKLKPYTIEQGGVLKVKEIQYVEGRSNVIIEYPGDGTSDATCAFVGSHFDVVHADPKQWDRNPFELIIDGDILYGRGTTDCLGHVALQTCIFITLAKLKPKLPISIIGVLIADEESGGSDAAVGVEGLMAHGELNILSPNSPVYWLDCADKQPNIGSGGVVQWRLTINGKMGHSGFPHKSINAIEMGTDVMRVLQKQFYNDYDKHPKEDEYGFPCSSSFKPTSISVPSGSLNQIAGKCIIEGDIRLVPFYKIKDAKKSIESYVKKLNLNEFQNIGPSSYVLESKESGTIQLEWLSEGIDGLACKLDSAGYKVLAEATKKFIGHVKPLADTGSLPLVADLQAAGYDVQTIGYGVEDAYHANNEFAKLSDFQQGFQILMSVVYELSKINLKK